MKKLFTFLAATFLITTLHAKIVYLNNNLEDPNISENLYTNWSDAYAAVSAGDTIYVFGSNFSYGEATIEKPITVLGPGYFLDENSNTQLNKENAKFGHVVLGNGADGAYLKGITLISGHGLDVHNQIDNITFENIYCDYLLNFRVSANGMIYDNITIKKCYLDGGVSMSGGRDGLFTNLVFVNNIVRDGFSIEEGSSGIISNNLFLGDGLNLRSTSSFEITNNIFLNEDEDNFTIQPLPDASVSNNISLTGAFGDDNDNFSAPQSTLFISDENASTDGQYMLSEDSPAKGAGTNGVDIGPFGGPDPYRLSGLPNLPNIYELSTGGFVSGDELSVQIKIKQ